MERVSVVIPCYNGGVSVKNAVSSARNQSWNNLEIIVVDDGSDDPETLRILRKMRDVNVIRQPNRGLPAARNAGIGAATGTYILPLDADDWIEPDTVEELMRAVKGSKGMVTAFTHYTLEGDLSGKLEKSYNFFEQLFFNQMPYCLLYPKAIWQLIGGYDTSMVNGYEDWEFNIRLGVNGFHAVVVPRPLFHYSVSKEGMLLSNSSGLHGLIWAHIQNTHKSLYNFKSLLRLWHVWRKKPSTYPLVFYFGWLILFRILPSTTFTRVFLALRMFSHSRRVSAQNSLL